MPINSFLYPAKHVAVAYEVANSLRFNSGSSDNLLRSPSSSGNRQIFTFSAWIKRSAISSSTTYAIAYFGATSTTSGTTVIRLVNDALQVYIRDGSSNKLLTTNRLFRDLSAWMHIVVAIDTTQGTDTNRVKLYVSGVQETSFSSSQYPTQNLNSNVNTSGQNNRFGVYATSGGSLQSYYDGYMAECVLIDGQQLDPTSFGEFDEDSGIWKPIDVSGLTFGTNGFYLDFEDSSALGNDAAGSNNFTVNNLTAIDQSTDTCTNNFATMNPLHSGAVTFAEGNLQVSRSGSGQSWLNSLSTFAPTSGKWYVEIKVNSVGSNGLNMGFANFDLSNLQNVTTGPGEDATSAGLYSNGGPIFYASGTTFATVGSPSGIMQLAMDLDNGFLYWGKNGTWLNSANPESGATGTGGLALSNLSTGGSYGIALAARNGGDVSFNFGSPPFSISSGNTDGNDYGNFEYAVPSGYYALNTKNLAEYG